ncbi:putative secreted protein (Por secretion system target) [Dyadobacter jejuensis]|uniref:Putative secreted protein (Por secretion system target) n=1 Tax=Dyadobacter jejuensis TaxID=1082580 RepID=A0A316AN53_9BACT|nr:S8 family peptidase [Dyadobacter jejuensis]PWJ58210.1 putative secreted protein (Por secretion system target) [Dyadobacter jejuensis]
MMRITPVRTLLTLLLVSLILWRAQAQTDPRYLVLFTDKANSSYSLEAPAEFLSEASISRRQKQDIPLHDSDLPVSEAYLDGVRSTGAKVIATTRWLNGALVEATSNQLAAIKTLSFFKEVVLNNPVAMGQEPGIARIASNTSSAATLDEIDYGKMRTQTLLLGADYFHQKGFMGQGMYIAVIDNGFSRIDQLSYFSQLFQENRILDTYDFIQRESNVYDKDSHGTNVLSTIAAYEPGLMVGIAPMANFALYRTENDAIESPYEEVTWLLAAERADSMGVDIISSSLGYSFFDGAFNTPDYNYVYQDMDGHTTIVSKAARWATRKGILVVNSAGNEGNSLWKYVVAPADVDSVLSVGATSTTRTYASFSSQGPNASGQMKPDLSAVGLGVYVGSNTGTGTAIASQGTSFSCPQIAGLSALVWQAYPFLKAQELISVLKNSGHLAEKPDNFLGYGVPDLHVVEQLIADSYGPLATEPTQGLSMMVAPNPVGSVLALKVPASFIGSIANADIIQANGISIQRTVISLNATTYLPIAELASGVYLLNVQIGHQQQVIRFVKL